jgi:ferrous iron transport protein B
LLTGLNQKVGNFPGVTVEKKTGEYKISKDLHATVIDLPGAYSLYPRRSDEWIAYGALMNPGHQEKIDVVIVIADASNLKRNLLYASQVIDLKIPVVIALTMMDLAKKRGVRIDIAGLQKELGIPVVPINPRANKGVLPLNTAIREALQKNGDSPALNFINAKGLAMQPVEEIKQIFPHISDYSAIHYLINHESFDLDHATQNRIENIEVKNKFNHTRVQAEEIMERYARIGQIMQKTVTETTREQKKMFSEKFDNILIHRVWGYVILMLVLFLLFQSVFWVAEYPMNAIEWSFGKLAAWLESVLAENWFSNLLINGIIAGLSGILVFVPQIMILFGLITLLEDTGYMARISFLADKLMHKVGMNGKSVMPMISGFACAVPAIMSARNIENSKERLLTIMVTPLMSCSARLPVFTILIALVIPKTYLLGFLSLQGLVMMGLYLLGLFMGLIVSYIMKWFIRTREKSFFILELPLYRSPRWRNVLVTMVQKARIFVVDAGKVIMVISLLLWVLSSFGPESPRESVRSKYNELISLNPENSNQLKVEKNAVLLEKSYAGIMGRAIEPVLEPLGFDWKIGIALITSFAAREVFVGTMATLYSVGEDADENSPTLRQKMQAAKTPEGKKVYTLATGVSLMIFYLLAMQCMSTLAIVKRETRSWKWPLIQLAYMTFLAYFMSLIAYQVLK